MADPYGLHTYEGFEIEDMDAAYQRLQDDALKELAWASRGIFNDRMPDRRPVGLPAAYREALVALADAADLVRYLRHSNPNRGESDDD